MFVLPDRKYLPLALALVAALATGCSEKLESGVACPALCPPQNLEIVDTVIELDARTLLDTTIAGFPGLGLEEFVLVTLRGSGSDTLETRGVLRFDSLETRWRPTLADTLRPITTIDSVYLRLALARVVRAAAVTIEAVDVGATDDTSAAALAPYFEDPAKLLGARTFAPTDSLKDSVRVPLDPAKVLAKLQNPAAPRLRVGLRVRSTAPVELRLGTTNNGAPAQIFYDPSPDTTVRPIPNNPLSLTPRGEADIAGALADYTLLVRVPPGPDATRLAAGGLPGRRIYLRFDSLPRRIVDSSTVVRATLTLTQAPNRTIGTPDSIVMRPYLVVANVSVRDPSVAVRLLLDAGGTIPDSVVATQADSGARTFELVRLVRTWRLTGRDTLSRALVLRVPREGSLPGELRFYSTDPAVPRALRPRLLISYIPREEIGLP